MTYKNPLRKSSHLWLKISQRIVYVFCQDFTASQASKILKIERKTINWRYNYLREVLVWRQIKEKNTIFDWVIEIDESYFWAKRVRWKRWRWAWWKIKVFWLLKREWKVYTQIIDDVSAKTLIPIIRWKIETTSIMNTDWWKSYDWLVDVWYEKHYRVHHWDNEFVRGTQHINWIESFRSYCKRRLYKFNGIKNDKFLLHLKECEFRFNCWRIYIDMYKELMKLCKKFTKLL